MDSALDSLTQRAKARVRRSGLHGLPTLLLLFLGCKHGAPIQPPTAPPARRVLLVTIDGLMPEVYLEPDSLGLKVPTLRLLAGTGAVSSGAMTTFPSVTYPAHTTLATGVPPAVHGITSNQPLDPIDRADGAWCWYSEDIKAPTLWDLARERGLKTALVNWPVTVGARAEANVPEYWRTGGPDDRKLARALSTPGLLEAVARRFPGFETRFEPAQINDETAADIAVHVVHTLRPELLLVHLPSVDHHQHEGGLRSPEALAAIEEADRQLARIVDAYRATGLWEHTTVVVASDHGFQPVSRVLHVGVLLREHGLADLDSGKRKTATSARPSNVSVITNGGQAYFYVNEQADTAVVDKLSTMLRERVGRENSGIGRIYTTEEIRVRGGDARALLAIEAADGFKLSSNFDGPAITVTASTGGAHGFDPERPSMAAALLVSGAGIKPGRLERATLLDVAPSIRRWLGLPITQSDKTLSIAVAK